MKFYVRKKGGIDTTVLIACADTIGKGVDKKYLKEHGGPKAGLSLSLDVHQGKSQHILIGS